MVKNIEYEFECCHCGKKEWYVYSAEDDPQELECRYCGGDLVLVKQVKHGKV